LVSPARFDVEHYGAAFTAALNLQTVAQELPQGAAFISLGQNCSTAWFLQAVGKRTCSTPFDWIFTSAQIIEHCIRDDFREFLDLRYVVPFPGDDSRAGHARYHANMFFHGNPHVRDYHARLQRSVARFRDFYQSNRPLVFVATVLPEHAMRPAWHDGFIYDFAAPANVNPLEEYAALNALFAERAAPTRLIILEQRTGQPRPRIEVTGRRAGIISIAIDVCGASTGVYYVNLLDETLCRVLFASMLSSVS